MNKEDKIFKLDKKEICITSTQIKRAIDLLVDENEILRDRIYELEDEIERLKNGYCELKVKCNNGECDCTNEEYDGMVESNIKLSLKIDKLNNIINEIKKLCKENKQYGTDDEGYDDAYYDYIYVKDIEEILKEGK